MQYEPKAENIIWAKSRKYMPRQTLEILAGHMMWGSRRPPPSILIYLLRSILWCGISVKVSSNTELAQRISDQGEKLVPWVMVAVGIYVMSNTDTDSLPAGIT